MYTIPQKSLLKTHWWLSPSGAGHCQNKYSSGAQQFLAVTKCNTLEDTRWQQQHAPVSRCPWAQITKPRELWGGEWQIGTRRVMGSVEVMSAISKLSSQAQSTYTNLLQLCSWYRSVLTQGASMDLPGGKGTNIPLLQGNLWRPKLPL